MCLSGQSDPVFKFHILIGSGEVSSSGACKLQIYCDDKILESIFLFKQTSTILY
jgi:hypothetical protein